MIFQGTHDSKRADALQSAIGQIEKQFGKGSIMNLGNQKSLEVECVPTGSLALDIALGGRGLPRGRIVEVFGPESSGKTTLCLTLVAKVQKLGGTAAYIDAEHALDPSYAKRIGVNVEQLLVSQPDSGEQALEIAEALVRSNAVDVIIVDSVAALVPRAELEGEMGDVHVGLQARLMSQALRKLCAAIARSKSIVVFINQIREKIGVMFGNPETTPGGRALKFYASVRIEVRRVTTLKDGEQDIGNRLKATVVKNKIAPPFRRAEIDLLFDSGISFEGDLLDLGEAHGVLEKSGSWYGFKADKLGQSREKARAFLRDNRKIAAELEQEIRKKVGLANGHAAEEKKPAKAAAK